MFRRTNLSAKYRQYAKSLEAFKNNTFEISSSAKCKVSQKLHAKKSAAENHLVAKCKQCTEILHNLKAIIPKPPLNIISTTYIKFNDTKCKSDNISLEANTKSRILTLRALGLPVVAAGASTSGYTEYDYEILKELGVIPVTNDNLSEPAENANSMLTSLTDSASNNFLPPLSQHHQYSSIFDNMPEQTNNLYTTLSNAFSSMSDKSSQTDLDALNATLTPGDGIVTATITSTNASNHTETTSALLDSNPDNTFSVSSEIVVEPIPEPPSAPDLAAEAASQINALGEATFTSLGLGGWTPVGIVQQCFEYLHVSMGVPWWAAIAMGTLVIRFAMFPLVIMAQKNAARMNNHLPQMQVIQLKMTEARQSGNQIEVARYSQELMTFMKEKNMNPFKNMIVPLAQMPVFVSFFMGLRQMANVPVDSLRTGGLFWFTDLTVPDQFFALPIITSLTLWATVELGTDAARLSSQNLQTMKYVLRAMPLFILPFTVNFPGAILCYWVSSNFISLAQVGFLRIPAVREYFQIDALLKHDPKKLPIKNKGFVGGLKDSWTNIKITKELEERKRLDELQFQRAGKGPLVKTYKYDPTKQVGPTIKAKSANSN